MKINTNSWHYRLWRDSFRESIYGVPEKIDLCRYCHRVFWQVVGRVLAVALVIGGVGCIVYAFYVTFILHFIMAMKITGIVLAAFLIPCLYLFWLHRRPYDYPREPKTLVGKWVQARKQRVCPMIEFTDEDK